MGGLCPIKCCHLNDYSLFGAYFLTICTHKFQYLFGEIEFGARGNSTHLSDIGIIVQKNIEGLQERFPEFDILNYVIMPNHIHILVLKVDIGSSNCRTVSDFVCSFKSLA